MSIRTAIRKATEEHLNKLGKANCINIARLENNMYIAQKRAIEYEINRNKA